MREWPLMFGFIDTIKIGAGVAAGILGAMVYWTGLPLINEYPILHKIPIVGQLAVGHAETVKEQGRAEIRIAWADANRKAELRVIAKQQDQQKQIDAADAALANQRENAGAKIEALETALVEERAKHAKPTGSNACTDDDTMPDGVRGALNAIR